MAVDALGHVIAGYTRSGSPILAPVQQGFTRAGAPNMVTPDYAPVVPVVHPATAGLMDFIRSGIPVAGAVNPITAPAIMGAQAAYNYMLRPDSAPAAPKPAVTPKQDTGSTSSAAATPKNVTTQDLIGQSLANILLSGKPLSLRQLGAIATAAPAQPRPISQTDLATAQASDVFKGLLALDLQKAAAETDAKKRADATHSAYMDFASRQAQLAARGGAINAQVGLGMVNPDGTPVG